MDDTDAWAGGWNYTIILGRPPVYSYYSYSLYNIYGQEENIDGKGCLKPLKVALGVHTQQTSTPRYLVAQSTQGNNKDKSNYTMTVTKPVRVLYDLRQQYDRRLKPYSELQLLPSH